MKTIIKYLLASLFFQSIFCVHKITLHPRKYPKFKTTSSTSTTTASTTTVTQTTTNSNNKLSWPLDDFDAGPFSFVSQQGSTIQMDCHFNTSLDANVTWSKEGMAEDLTFNNNTLHWDKRFLAEANHEENKWTLEIRFVQKSDNGTYKCSVSGKYVTIRSYYLHVHTAKAKILDAYNATISVDVGDVLRISCILVNSTETPLYIFWYKDDTVINFNLTDGASVVESLQGSEIIVPKVELSDQGNYSCVPSNAEQDNIYVWITEPKKKPNT